MPPKRKAAAKQTEKKAVQPRKKAKVEEEEEEEVAPTREKSSRLSKKEEVEKSNENEIGTWTQDGSLLVLNSPAIKGSKKIYGFDMDSTLIETKSGKVFAQHRGDWVWLFPCVPDKLRSLHNDGYKIVIITNQNGINGKNGWDESKASAIKGKIQDLSKELGFPLQVLAATTDDIYRKPSTSMWDYLVENMNEGIKPDLEDCMYIGDAAGRPEKWKPKKKKDFSCGDRKLAFNVGVKFQTESEFFLEESPVEFSWNSVDPTTIPTDGKITSSGEKEFHAKEQEMVVFVGFPAAGKSTFAKRYFVSQDYVHVNRDTLKTPKKCHDAARAGLKSGKSVVVDNTNPTKDGRADYIAIAQEHGVPCRCFRFTTEENVAKHLNYFREKITEGDSPHVPRVGYAMYKKSFVEPVRSEGFSEVKEINFVPQLETDKEKCLFFQFASE
eukprot:Lithocolla_globosa_v1_NODE_4396_length_1446_cov_2.690870.p1 type:complete len:440 gc:universal NODE_4396_length_1446_cov_2.690870:1331-12(-)